MGSRKKKPAELKRGKTRTGKTILNAKKSRTNRDKAIERAEKGAGSWLGHAYRVARRVAEQFQFFTTDDVWKAGLVKPDEPRALGPVMLSLERDGIIAATSKFKSTAQPSRNCAPVRLWRSCIYVG